VNLSWLLGAFTFPGLFLWSLLSLDSGSATGGNFMFYFVIGFVLGIFLFSYGADRMIEQKAEQKGWIEIRGRKFRVIEINGTQGEDIGGGE
jgi:hypothetical protein